VTEGVQPGCVENRMCPDTGDTAAHLNRTVGRAVCSQRDCNKLLRLPAFTL
jgi:hypothetical protein